MVNYDLFITIHTHIFILTNIQNTIRIYIIVYKKRYTRHGLLVGRR